MGIKINKTDFLPKIFSNQENQTKNNNSIFNGLFPNEEPLVKFSKNINPTILNPDGSVNFNEYTLDKLKQRYPEDLYKIETLNDSGVESITVADKQSNKVILVIEHFTDEFGKKLDKITYPKDDDSDNLIMKTYCDGHLLNEILSTRDYQYIEMSYFDNKQQLESKMYKNDNDEDIVQSYHNGILIQEDNQATGESRNILSEQLVSLLSEPNLEKRGNAQVWDDIFKGIDETNINGLLIDYEEQTNNKLVKDLMENKFSLSGEQQNAIIMHIIKSYQMLSPFIHDIAQNIKNNDVYNFNNNIEEINEDTVLGICHNLLDGFPGDLFINKSGFLFDTILTVFDLTKAQPDIYGAIFGKITSAMEEYIKKQGGYCDDIMRDMKSHMNDPIKYKIDFTRLANRMGTQPVQILYPEEAGEANGVFDEENVRQRYTGDCWLLAGLISIMNKPGGREILNNCLKKDSDGNIIVKLKGVNKEYIITQDEIAQSTHLSAGKSDVRAIEIAIDRYLRDTAYEKGITANLFNVDTNGGLGSTLFKCILGNSCETTYVNWRTEDFNNDGKVYSFGHTDLSCSIMAINSAGEEEEIIPNHEFSIVKSDEEFIYVNNPHDSDDELRIPRKNFRPLTPYHLSSSSLSGDDNNSEYYMFGDNLSKEGEVS